MYQKNHFIMHNMYPSSVTLEAIYVDILGGFCIEVHKMKVDNMEWNGMEEGLIQWLFLHLQLTKVNVLLALACRTIVP
jgi:hypothetical protein